MNLQETLVWCNLIMNWLNIHHWIPDISKMQWEMRCMHNDIFQKFKKCTVLLEICENNGSSFENSVDLSSWIQSLCALSIYCDHASRSSLLLFFHLYMGGKDEPWKLCSKYRKVHYDADLKGRSSCLKEIFQSFS